MKLLRDDRRRGKGREIKEGRKGTEKRDEGRCEKEQEGRKRNEGERKTRRKLPLVLSYAIWR